MGAVLGFSKVAMYFSLRRRVVREERAMVSPPLWGVVAGGKPSSSNVGGEKLPLGPERDEYDVSTAFLNAPFRSGDDVGGSCEKRSEISPGSESNKGAGIGLGTSPIFFAAAWSCVMLMVGLLPFFLTISEGSQSVRPVLVITSTPACLASELMSESRSTA